MTKKMICDFDPNNVALLRCAVEVGQPAEVKAALIHAASGFRSRLLAADGANKLLLLKPPTAFDGIVARMVLQEIADREGRGITIHWIPNPGGHGSPDIEWRLNKTMTPDQP